MKRPRARRPRRLLFENLEPREVMAASVTAALDTSGVLNVVGSDADDQIYFQQSKGYISIQGVNGSWSAKSVGSIVVDLKGGDDFVSLDSKANGGKQKMKELVTVQSGNGDEAVRIAGVQDVYFSGLGQTLAVSATGKPTLNGVPLNMTSKVVTKFSGGVLTVFGTNGQDDLRFRQIKDKISIVGVKGSWAATKVNSIVVHLQAGNDTVSLASLSNGGNQALNESVTVHSGSGNESVRLANGQVVNFSGLGHTLVVAANGTATLDGQPVNQVDPPTPPPSGNWFDTNVVDTALRSLGSSLYADGSINRNDMLALFQSAQDGGIVDTTEFNDLKAIVSHTTLFGTFDYVWKLSSYIVNGNAANAKFQGQALGDLTVGATATHLGNLVNKWFLGLDRPTASGTYRQFAGTLFVNGVAYTDIRQGNVGDCYLMASLSETALRNAAAINNMFIVNGDGTYTVRFYNAGKAEYVSVDSFLPTNASGYLTYASRGLHYSGSGNELWVALAEKAYVQLHEMGWVRPGLSGNGQNSYSAISGGYIYAALGHVTGQATTAFAMTGSSATFTTFVNAWNAGKSIGFASYQTPASSSVVGSHAYAVVSYNTSTQSVTLYNPWGPEYALVTMTWSQIQANFMYFDRTA